MIFIFFLDYVRIFVHLFQVPNNYETDLIYPIIEEASKMAKVSYDEANDATKTNLKVLCGIFIFRSLLFHARVFIGF